MTGAITTTSSGPPAGGRRVRAVGGVAAQGSQALSSFVLQIVAARLLGVEGLGRFATLYAIIVLATAVSSGFVGDSLTVLDRTAPQVRAGLQAWWFILGIGSGISAWLGSWLSGFLDASTAVAFGVATAVFLLEDALRRMLMASLRFWRIVWVDLSGLAGSLAVMVTTGLWSGHLSLGKLLVALAVGQAVALLVAVVLLSGHERRFAALRPAALGAVAAYGIWRALQQAVRPALLALVKTLCLVLAGAAAAGRLEAARIYTAPALLVVGGVSSFLFASYAADRTTRLPALLRRADRSVAGLIGVVVTFGLAVAFALPLLGQLLTAGRYELSVPAVLGWSLYAASVAAVTPYGSLAAVHGRQKMVLCIRVTDSLLSLGLVGLLLATGVNSEWLPVAMAVGSLAGGVAIRHLLSKVVRPATK